MQTPHLPRCLHRPWLHREPPLVKPVNAIRYGADGVTHPPVTQGCRGPTLVGHAHHIAGSQSRGLSWTGCMPSRRIRCPSCAKEQAELGRPMTTQERTDAMSEFYIPVTPEAAGCCMHWCGRPARRRWSNSGCRSASPRIHLAAAVRDNGSGRVVTTELSDSKIAAAKQTFAEDRPGRRDHHSRRRCADHPHKSWTGRSISCCSTVGKISTYR